MNRNNRQDRPSNIIQAIKERYADLSETNKKIADFIAQNLAMATFSTLSDLSKQIGVSDTTLIRFARAMEFKGYQDLREALIDYIERIIYPSQKAALFDEKWQHPILDVAMRKDIEYITKTMTNIDREWFDELIQLIISARGIYCMGWGMSSFLAEYLFHQLSFLSYRAHPVIRDRRPLIQQVLFLGKGDVLIVFDLVLYSVEILEAVEFVHRNSPEVKIITITNDPLAHIVQYGDINLFCDMSGHDFRLISMTAPLCLINAIIEEVVEKSPRKSRRALTMFQNWVQSSPLHYSPFAGQQFQWEPSKKRGLMPAKKDRSEKEPQ